MDKKKAFLIILLATLLAFVIALVIKPKKEKDFSEIEQPIEEQLKVNSEEDILLKEDVVSQNVEEPTVTTILEEKKEVKKNDVVSKSESKQPVFEKLEVKEVVSKVEEAGVYFDDPGIIDENGIIVVTRDFKVKSPRKYSFKDFGVLSAPPIR